MSRISHAVAFVAVVLVAHIGIKAYVWVALALQSLVHGWELPGIAW